MRQVSRLDPAKPDLEKERYFWLRKEFRIVRKMVAEAKSAAEHSKLAKRRDRIVKEAHALVNKRNTSFPKWRRNRI